jgi:hypothetical protein
LYIVATMPKSWSQRVKQGAQQAVAAAEAKQAAAQGGGGRKAKARRSRGGVSGPGLSAKQRAEFTALTDRAKQQALTEDGLHFLEAVTSPLTVNDEVFHRAPDFERTKTVGRALRSAYTGVIAAGVNNMFIEAHWNTDADDTIGRFATAATSTATAFTASTNLEHAKATAIKANTKTTYRVIGSAIKVNLEPIGAIAATGVIYGIRSTLSAYTGAAWKTMDELEAAARDISRPFSAKEGCTARLEFKSGWVEAEATNKATALNQDRVGVMLKGLTPGSVVHIEMIMLLELQPTNDGPLEGKPSPVDPNYYMLQALSTGPEFPLYSNGSSLKSLLSKIVKAGVRGAGSAMAMKGRDLAKMGLGPFGEASYDHFLTLIRSSPAAQAFLDKMK